MKKIDVYNVCCEKLEKLADINDCWVADIVEEILEEYIENHDLADDLRDE